jgi:signal transduction histidine kinase
MFSARLFKKLLPLHTVGTEDKMSATEKVSILVVDDDPGKLLSYEVVLSELGENLIQATSGSEAFTQLLKNDIAVVLMDVSMPHLDGFELADMIRQHPRFEQTPIIFVSAVHMTDLDRLKGYQRGAVDYIAVPVIPELLRAKVRVFCELHKKSRQLRALNEELRLLSSRLLVAQDAERRRIARELHDGLGQELAAAKMTLDSIPAKNSVELKLNAAAEASGIIDRAVQQVRSVSYLLHPPLLDEVGLASALRWYLDGLAKRSGIESSLDIQPVDFPRLASDVETAVFRIVQESLTNVFRHAEAHKVRVTLARRGQQLAITVLDDGKGISGRISEFRPDSIGVGVGGMRQRVKEFGGEFRLSNANPGTRVEVIIPLSGPSFHGTRTTPGPTQGLERRSSKRPLGSRGAANL